MTHETMCDTSSETAEALAEILTIFGGEFSADGNYGSAREAFRAANLLRALSAERDAKDSAKDRRIAELEAELASISKEAGDMIALTEIQHRDHTPIPKSISFDDANSRNESDQVYGDQIIRLDAAISRARALIGTEGEG